MPQPSRNSRNNGRRNPANRQGVTLKPSTKVSRTSKKGKHGIPQSRRKVQKKVKEIITYVLDTNVLMYSWTALYQFEEHNVCIVGQVWKELDASKKGHAEKAANARKSIRAIDTLVAGKKADVLKAGIVLIPPPEITNGKPHTGKLILDFSVPKIPDPSQIELSLDQPDDRILMVCLALQASGKRVVLVTKDGNFRVKAAMAGIEAEDYLSDQIVSLAGEEDLSTGFHVVKKAMWSRCKQVDITTKEGGVTEYSITDQMFQGVNPNEFLVVPSNKPRKSTVLRITDTSKKAGSIKAETLVLGNSMRAYSVDPRNIEQSMALELLMDKNIEGVSIAGLAGSGKTYLTLAAALEQKDLYKRVIVTRSAVGSDEDIGYLPGTEKEKMDPWMGGLYDNLESITGGPGATKSETDTTAWFLQMSRNVQVMSLNFMKGRSFENTFIIVDEAQDLNPKTLKMIATRVGKGSKIVFLGNVSQIDNSYVNEFSNGLSVYIRSFSDSALSGHITLQQGERSPFATEAEKRL